jgi:hypothetical protein
VARLNRTYCVNGEHEARPRPLAVLLLGGHSVRVKFRGMGKLSDLAGSQWRGKKELWLDPMGNDVILCDCTVSIDEAGLSYSWSYEGRPQEGRLALNEQGADFSDSWHARTSMACSNAAASWARVDVTGKYGDGEGSEWGWRITLSLRSDHELVLQMTNIAPWGEEGRAVRMVCRRSN